MEYQITFKRNGDQAQRARVIAANEEAVRNIYADCVVTHIEPVEAAAHPKAELPKAITWEEAMLGRERDFNLRYYGNKDGEPRFPHEGV